MKLLLINYFAVFANDFDIFKPAYRNNIIGFVLRFALQFQNQRLALVYREIFPHNRVIFGNRNEIKFYCRASIVKYINIILRHSQEIFIGQHFFVAIFFRFTVKKAICHEIMRVCVKFESGFVYNFSKLINNLLVIGNQLKCQIPRIHLPHNLRRAEIKPRG